MKVLGEIGGNETVLDQNDGANALRLVTSIPEPDGSVNAIQLAVDVGSYKRGTIFVYDGGSWREVTIAVSEVGDVHHVLYPRVKRDVKIKWQDPDDGETHRWKHTLLVRKYKSSPVDPYDGVVVVDSYVRDQYAKSPCHDILPAGTENDWYYRFFTFTDSEIYHTSKACEFQPIELTWKTMQSIVRDGLISKVLSLGDTIIVENEDDPDDPVYGSLEFEVVAFDQATPADMSLTRSVTLALVNPLADAKTIWDVKWPMYRLTTDVRVTDRSKVYYTQDPIVGAYIPVSGFPIGKILTPGTYYERLEEDRRTQLGGNRWSVSALRSWLNSTDPDDLWKGFDGHPAGVKPPLTQMPKEVVDVITRSRNRTAIPSIDGRGQDISIDHLFLLSMTEVFGEPVEDSYFFKTSDRIPQEFYQKTEDDERDHDKSYFVRDIETSGYRPARDVDFNGDGSFDPTIEYFEVIEKDYYLVKDGEYVKCMEDDFNADHTFKPAADVGDYYEKKVEIVEEGRHLVHFDDEELNPRIRTNVDGEPRSWWLRTHEVESDVTVKAVAADGTLIGDQPVYNIDTGHHLIFGFVVA